MRRQVDREFRRFRDGLHRQRQAAAKLDIAPFGARDKGCGDGFGRDVLHLFIENEPFAERPDDTARHDERRAGAQFAVEADVMLAGYQYGIGAALGPGAET